MNILVDMGVSKVLGFFYIYIKPIKVNLHKLILFRRACHWLLTLCLSVGSLGLLWWLYFSLNFPEWHSWISITISEHKWLQTAEHARQPKKYSRLCQGQSVGSFTAQDKPGSHTPSQQAEKSHCCLRRYWKPRLCKGHVLFSGPPAGMQSAVCRVSLPTWQALWCVLRHWGQKHSVWTARRRLQTLAHVEGKGMTDDLLIQTKCVFNHHQKCELENDSSHI